MKQANISQHSGSVSWVANSGLNLPVFKDTVAVGLVGMNSYNLLVTTTFL